MKWAFLFPGQGAQAVGMGLELARTHAVAREVFEVADRALGFSLSRLCFHGPAEDLDLTENTQPALVTASVAAWAVLNESGIRPSVVAGLSLGEYAALVAAGSLDLPDAVRLVRNRGRYQQECVAPGQGAMAAILGLDPETVAEICRQATSNGHLVETANFNGPEQIVVSGHTQAVQRACKIALSRGARKAVPLKVSAPFHCSLLEEAGRKLRTDLERINLRPARVPMVANATGWRVSDPKAIIDVLVHGVSRPVLWNKCVETIGSLGIEAWAEVGPGTVLSGTVKRIIPGIEPVAAGTPDGIAALLEVHGRVS